MKRRIVLSIFIIIWLVLLKRVFNLSIKSNHYYEELADRNTIKKENIPPIRGEILDANNIPLAVNKLGFSLKITPHLNKKGKIHLLNKELDYITKLLPFLDKKKLLKKYIKNDSFYNYNFVTIIDFIPYEKIIDVYSKLNLKELIKLEPSSKRYYPAKNISAHTIGYVAKANKKDIKNNPVAKITGKIGKIGLEKYYNNFLQGEVGYRTIKVSAYNEEIEEIEYIGAKDQRNIILNIDIRLQKYINKIFKNKAGAVIVMGVDGKVISSSSYPEYDLNTFVSGISSRKWEKIQNDIDTPFINKMVNGLYPPGSIVKTGIGLIYITNGFNKRIKFNCTGELELGNRKFRCWKEKGHNKTNIIKALRESCDDYFYKGSMKVGIKNIANNLKRYGLGGKTNIDLPNEFIGTVPSREWKRKKYGKFWYIGETLNTSIGQGDFLTTPIQHAVFTTLMATGKLVTPRIAKYLGGKEIKPIYKEILNNKEKRKLPIIQKAMYEVVNKPTGTAYKYLKSKKVKVAAKTGTAQVIGISQKIKKRLKEEELEYMQRSHAWISAYGPYKNPQYVVSVLVEHGGHGGQTTGDIAAKIFDKLYDLKYIKS